MIKSLLTKEEKYFEDFRVMISHIQQMTKYTEQLFAGELVSRNRYLNIKLLELRCQVRILTILLSAIFTVITYEIVIGVAGLF